MKNDRKERRKSSIDLSNMVYGKVPPQARELEETILGAIMLEKGAFETACEILSDKSFYLDSSQRIFKAMQALAQRSSPIDIFTVVEQLKFMESLDLVGGAHAVTKLTNSVVSAANLETHARIVQQKFLAREIIRISGEAISDAYEDSTDVFDLLDQHERQLTELTTSVSRSNYSMIDTELARAMTRIEDLRAKEQHITGVPSGYKDLDRITHGWQPGDLIVLAARPSVGKTAFALKNACNASKVANTWVGFFSLEMSNSQLTHRIISCESKVWLERVVNGQCDEHEMKKIYTAMSVMGKLRIVMDDTGAQTLFEIRRKARLWKRKYGMGLMIVDYLQLMSGEEGSRGNREQEISKISRGLKALAKELQIPIIALSQLSREPEKRSGDGKMPVLSDLRESGAIEQDADLVMFMYRPDYYLSTGINILGESTGETIIKIAKHRNGKLADVRLRANLAVQDFIDWDGIVPPAPNGESWKPVQSNSDLFTEESMKKKVEKLDETDLDELYKEKEKPW